MPYEEDKLLHEAPIKKNNIGKVIHKAGEWYDNHTQCSPFDEIEGYVLETTHRMLQEKEEYQRKENIELRNKLQTKSEVKVKLEEEYEDHLNLMLDIKRIEKVIRRLDTRSRKSKIDDVTVRCANAIGLLEGKKLQLILAVTGVTKIIKKDKRFNSC